MDKQRSRFSLSAWRSSPGVRAAAVVILLAFINVQLASAAPVPWDKPASYPAWWFQSEVMRRLDGANAFPSWQNGDYPVPDDFAVANVGQLKQMASKAAAELNANLPGGAGSPINNLVNQWNQPPPPGSIRDDFGVLNVGQLKSVAKLFYDRLIAVHCLDSYPWNGVDSDDYAVANVGQLKNLFSFDVALDTNVDGLPDWWELYSYGTTDLNPSDPDGLLDNRSILEAFRAGLIPDFFHGALPTLTVLSGNEQVGGFGAILSAPLVIQVTDSAGHPIGHAPVTLAITDGFLSISGDLGSAATTVRANADANGLVTVSIFAPNFETGFTVTATAWSGGQSATTTASGSASASAGEPGLPPAENTPPPLPIANIAPPDCWLQQVAGTAPNTAFRQYTNDPQPFKWYLTEIIDSTTHAEGTITSTDSTINGNTVNSTGTYHSETTKSPIYRGITYSGHSELHSTGTTLGYSEKVDATADEAIDGTWYGSKTTNTNTQTISSPPSGANTGWPILTLPTSITSYHSYNDSGVTVTLSGTQTLQDEYTMDQFAQDILDIGNSSGWSKAIPFIAGNPISTRFIASDESWGIMVKGAYKFTNPQQFKTPTLDYTWYEVFIPDDPSHAMTISAPMTWANVGSATTSEIHTIDPFSQKENGNWYLARLSVQEYSSYPACQWRNTVGAGETVSVSFGGLPPSATNGMTWKATGGTITPSGSSATFVAGTAAGPAVITATLANGKQFSVTLNIKIPVTITEKRAGRAFRPGEIPGWDPHWAGAGMRVAVTIEPTDVSFSGLQFRELPGPARVATGVLALGNTNHDPTGGKDVKWIPIWPNNVSVGVDFCYIARAPIFFPGVGFSYGPNGGTLIWDIPYVFRLTDDKGNGVPFARTPTATQTMTIDGNGTTTVTKEGAGTPPLSTSRPWTK